MNHANSGIPDNTEKKYPGASGTAEGAGLEALERLLGADRICVDPAVLDRYARSTTGGGTRPAAVVYPDTTEGIQRVVRLAGERGLKLYPISRGRNWGYGDACAPTAGQVIVDLGRMDRIVEVNRELAYAVVEPGVTQGRLWEHLQRRAPDLWMDATGAGEGASILGNALERGFGHTDYGDHAASACGMEVVLADGRVLRTGFGGYAGARTAGVYRHGVGPGLEGLFAQSNFGIVARLGVWLMPRPEAFCAFVVRGARDGDLGEIIRRLAPLRRRGILRSAIHIGNDLRLLSGRMRYPFERTGGRTPLPPGVRAELRRELDVPAWIAGGGIYGPPAMVRAVRAALRRAMGPYRPVFLTDRRLARARRVARLAGGTRWGRRIAARLDLVEPVIDLLKGRPRDQPLAGARWRVRDPLPDASASVDPRDHHAGLMWAAPVVPMTAEDATRVMRLMEPIYEAHGFEPLTTFTLINERAMMCVSNLAFDTRDAEETARANACYQELTDRLIDAGYPPYRTTAAGARRLAEHAPLFWETAGRIKNALDPGHILAPGRYGL